jgi:hypothetical protein
MLAPDERSLQVDLLRLDWTVPVAGRIGSRDPLSFDTNSTWCGAVQSPVAITRWALSHLKLEILHIIDRAHHEVPNAGVLCSACELSLIWR